MLGDTPQARARIARLRLRRDGADFGKPEAQPLPDRHRRGVLIQARRQPDRVGEMDSPKLLAKRLIVDGRAQRGNPGEQRHHHPMGNFGVEHEEHRTQRALPEQVEQRGHRVCIVAVRGWRGKPVRG